MSTLPPEPSYTPFDPTEVRPILPLVTAGLESVVADVLASVPVGHKIALVAVATEVGGRVALLIRPYEHLSFVTYAEKPWYGPLGYGAKLIGSW